MAAGASIWLQSFHVRENNLFHSESLEVICRKTDIYIFISSSKSGTEQTEKNTKNTEIRFHKLHLLKTPKVEESYKLQHDYTATFPMQSDAINVEIYCCSKYCFERKKSNSETKNQLENLTNSIIYTSKNDICKTGGQTTKAVQNLSFYLLNLSIGVRRFNSIGMVGSDNFKALLKIRTYIYHMWRVWWPKSFRFSIILKHRKWVTSTSSQDINQNTSVLYLRSQALNVE